MNMEMLKKCVVKILGDSDNLVVGTGFFVSSAGYIVTCHHVIADLTTLKIEYDSELYPVMWCEALSSPDRDIAVLQIPRDELQGITLPDIGPGDYMDEVEEFGVGLPADGFGFPSDKNRDFADGFDMSGLIHPGQRTRIQPLSEKKAKIDALGSEQRKLWNILPPVSVEVYNFERANAGPGASGSPVLCKGKIVGFITARETLHERYAGERRAYVIKWKNMRFGWGNFPANPPERDQPNGEWSVTEAWNSSDFLEAARGLRSVLANSSGKDESDFVITLYARVPPSKDGDPFQVGSFEYDLLHYWNVKDPVLMFGPIIEGDERVKVTRSEDLWKLSDDPVWRRGGFAQREGIYTAAWFKLGNHLWASGFATRRTINPDDVKGLLFINARKASALSEDSLRKNKEFASVLSRIEGALPALIKARESRRVIRRAAAFQAAPTLTRAAATQRFTAYDINHMFSELLRVFEEISGNRNLAFNVFVSSRRDSGVRQIDWLWSNGPTGIGASTPLRDLEETNILWVKQVAQDPDLRPRLVHVHKNPEFADRVILTRPHNQVRSDLVVPILSHNAKPFLLGVVDIQGLEPPEFDTDDVQLVYELIDSFVSVFIANLMDRTLNPARPWVSPMLLTPGVYPFSPEKLGFRIRDLLSLNFNPMKYLFHWEKIQKLLQDEPVRFPATVEIWPSMQCNHYCDWCRTKRDRDLQPKNSLFMSEGGLRELALDFAEQSGLDILISGGGEPLLHPEIHKFMRILSESDAFETVGLFTNGTRPNDPKFWDYFFSAKSRHSFVRVSFNGDSPETYYQVHFDIHSPDKGYPGGYERHYAEAVKAVLDLLALRPPNCTVALGSTVDSRWLATTATQIAHAQQLGVDFIQIRPELVESAHGLGWQELRTIVQEEKEKFKGNEDFAVLYTDAERAYKDHDYDKCYARYLVPTLVPDFEPGWIRVLPCSYAMNKVGRVPILGRMKEGMTLTEFWSALNTRNERTPGISDLRLKDINPREGCPQCRYHMLNKRILAIDDPKDKDRRINLITKLVNGLKKDEPIVDDSVADALEKEWAELDFKVVDVSEAKAAFAMAKKLGIKPSL